MFDNTYLYEIKQIEIYEFNFLGITYEEMKNDIIFYKL